MPSSLALSPEVLSAKPQQRARRKQLWFAIGVAAVGGALGCAGVMLAGSMLIGAPATSQTTVSSAPFVSFTLPAPAPAAVDVSPSPFREVSTPPAPSGRAAAVVVAGTARLVISSAVDERWTGSAKPTVIEHDDVNLSIEKKVAPRALPPELRALVGKPVQLFDADGGHCVGRVGPLSAIRVLYGEIGQPGDSEFDLETSWEYDEPSLVATIEELGQGCDADFTAAVIGEGSFKPFAVTDIDETSLAKAAVNASRMSPNWSAIQSEFRAEVQNAKGTWDAEGAVHSTLVGTSAQGIVVTVTSVGGCGEFERTLALAYRVVDGEIGEPVLVPSDRWISIGAAIDANGDGEPELFSSSPYFSSYVIESQANGFAIREGLDVSWHMCRC